MKNRRKRKQTKNRVMSIRVLLTPDPHFTTCFLKSAEPITHQELKLVDGDPTLVSHLRAVNNFCTEQMNVEITHPNRVMERGYCIHKACACCTAITIDCKSMINYQGAMIQKIGNTNPKQRIIEIQSPLDITPQVYRNTIACPTFRKLKVLTKDQTIRLVSSIVAMTLPITHCHRTSKKTKC